MHHRREYWQSPVLGAARPIWFLILICAIGEVVAKLAVGLTFRLYDVIAVILIVITALGLSAFYTFKRPDDRIARLFRAAVELFLLTFLCGSISYSATSLDWPLWDAAFHAWDQALGFDWRYWLTVLDGYPKLNLLLVLAYHSMWPQLTLVLVALVTIRDYRRLDLLLLAFGFAAVATVIIAGFMPALSPLAYLQVTADDHPHITLALPREFEMQALALRSGAMRVVEVGNAQGLVTFPSFHTATAVVLLLGFRNVPYLRWVSLVLNSLMLISIPIEGSHYLVDVIAGIAVALAAWAAATATINADARLRLSSQRQQQPDGIAIHPL
jgi:membrane-associated phospholipid phosphatase